ncbi:MAG: DUF1361 domain-containing protein [Patescibacteria group bacterium]
MDKRFILPKGILVLLCLAVVLNIVRIVVFETYSFVYILWNIFLAIIPFAISSILLWYVKNKKPMKILLIIGGICWLLFFPNAPYIVTDIIHVNRGYAIRALYDSFLLFSSAWAGLLLGLHSLSHIEKIIRMKYSQGKTEAMMIAILLLSSFGIYLGRFLRFNTWDVIADPLSLGHRIITIVAYPHLHGIVFAHVTLFFGFIYLSYKAWKYERKDLTL